MLRTSLLLDREFKMKKQKKSSEQLSAFLNWITSVKSDYSMHFSAVNESDKTTQDLLHQIELGTYADRNKYCTLLSSTRKSRRKHKDYVDIHGELHKLIETPEFLKILKQLTTILGNMRKQEEKIATHSRMYVPRVVTDLKFVKEQSERKLK